MMNLKNLFTATFLLSSSTFTHADLQQCVDEVEDIHMANSRILLLATATLAKNYNSTCHGLGLCENNIDDDTLDYLMSANFKENPNLPSVPMVIDMTGEFVGFEDHVAWTAYYDTCEMVEGKVCRVNVDLDLKGAALDLVDVDIAVNFFHMPICITDACDGEDLEVALEKAVKTFVVQDMELDDKQAELINSLSRDSVCAGLGIGTCKFVIEDVDCSGDPINVPIFQADKKNKSSSSSAATNSGSVITALAIASSLIAAMV